MWVALEILGFWIVLSILTGLLWGVIAAGGWAAYWRGICHVFAPSNVSEHGDLSEGR